VFDMFDDLLLLKKGGQVVFYGETGVCSSNLIAYFEGLGASRRAAEQSAAGLALDYLTAQATENALS